MTTRKWIVSITAAIAATALLTIAAPAQKISSTGAKHQQYKVVVLPPDGGADSFEAGYLFYVPMNDRGEIGVSGDRSTPGFNSYTWIAGKQTDLQPLPQTSNLTGTATFINWINFWGMAAGYGTRTDSATGASLDHAAFWTPDGRAFALSTPPGGQSHAVWINDWGLVSGWIEDANSNPCSFGTGGNTLGVVWVFGTRRPLGTLGGLQSYGEFINDLGQVSGHSETTAQSDTNCPAYDPFIWQNGKMVDINPGNFGGSQGGTNFLSNGGHAVGFGTLQGEVVSNAFLWHDGRLTNLSAIGSLGGDLGSAFNANDRGDVVGVSSISDNSAFHAVLWRDTEFTDLGTLSGDACSQPFRINARDQVVGFSGSCDFTVLHAFLWENGTMTDLDTLLPSGSGLQLQSANWITDDGIIGAQAVITAGANSGAIRAVLLIPDDECDSNNDAALSSDVAVASAVAAQSNVAASPKKALQLKTEDGRLNPVFLRPFSPLELRKKMQD
jgi:probable HAF family extracellular repeat protein